jgi:hypothetical protein
MCSGHGVCNKSGQCVCDSQHFTESCSIYCVDSLIRATVTVAVITLESAHARRQARAAVLGVEALGPNSPALSVLSASPITMVQTATLSAILLQRAVGTACSCTSSGQCLCVEDYYGPGCGVYCDAAVTCSAHGKCSSTGSCGCLTHWGGDACDQCADDYFGPARDIFCEAAQTCGGHGVCDKSGQCECDSGYLTNSCSIYCVDSETCSGHGQCDDSGKCVCLGHFSGAECAECKEDYYGPGCDAFCTAMQNCGGHGTCSSVGACKCAANQW